MTRIYTPATRGYINVTTGLGRLLLVMTGAYLVFKPKEEVKEIPNPYSNFAENLEVTYFSPLNTVGVETKEIKDDDTIQGARDQIQVSYRVTGVDFGKATIKYGNKEEVIESPQSFPISFTISKSTVIEELDANGYLQVQISVTPASAQAEVRTVTFRYEGA
jgi:hypothetical protein